ncbi:helix-turn-helix domain-containing protein [Pedobacter rhizosphaerae]|uniref:AraC family transcriptional regulator, transcriptional activator of pobA n=1 Tax=Pedobacter rhizosphaerae TaxID=390241 RepID=A0A1H9SVN5_9SPHI|nr:helix-turn-helix transcriptional regulator [Pedobacter rhizosphaerae]SER88439.1 AraC family transcriptional regulator, transcriptional activator of pobA [Pedobacter rhizosphaerae]
MRTQKFHKTECGVDFLINVLPSDEFADTYLLKDTYDTDYLEIVFFKKGNGYLVLNHQRINISDNSIIFISPFQKREWNLNPDGLDFMVLVFQEDFLNDFFSDKLFTYRLLYFYQLAYPLYTQIDQVLVERYYALLSEIKSELVKTRADSVHIIRSLIYYLLQKLNREYAEIHHLAVEKNHHNEAFQFKQLLEIYIRDKQRINDYTSLLNINRIALNKAVKAQFNVTASHLLKQRLLVAIKDYLIHSKLTVSEIAFQLNFSEPNHLMRFFKNQTGITTTDFLNEYQNGINH